MLQPATASSVLGDFSRGRIALRGVEHRLQNRGGAYFIDGQPVQFTLGSRRIQHYLTTLAGGRITILAPSWDVLRKQWFHNMEIVDPEESDGSAVQVWNKSCFSCHVSREEKRFDATANRYATQWQDFGTNCERCHGPGGTHALLRRQDLTAAETHDSVVVPSRLSAARSTMVCAQCHSLRNIVAENFVAGAEYADYFMPVLEYGQKPGADPAYWADGRPRRFSNDAVGLWQSQCFLKGGARCTDCHTDVHDPAVDKNAAIQEGNKALCGSCHAALVRDAAAHSHHRERSAGAACVECHMPRTVFSIKASIRDHTLSVPSPENTVRYKIPNACTVCHRNEGAQWAMRKMNEWFGDKRGRLARRALAFTDARAGRPSAADPLLSIASDPSESAVIRANAVGYLSEFTADPRVAKVLVHALNDTEPLVRAVAALRVHSPADLIAALRDPVRSVRLGAVLSLVNMRVPRPPGHDGELFDRARDEYIARAAIQSDDGTEQFTLGGFQLLSGNAAGALSILENSLRLDPRVPARYFLAGALLQLNRPEEAMRALRAITSDDPYYSAAQQLLTVH